LDVRTTSEQHQSSGVLNRYTRTLPAITGAAREIQPHQHLISLLAHRPPSSGGSEKALTLRGPGSIRPAMAAGAIPPPLFFERRRRMSTAFEPLRRGGILQESTVKKHISVDQANRRHAHARPRSVTV